MVSIIFSLIHCVVLATHQLEVSGVPGSIALVQLQARAAPSLKPPAIAGNAVDSDGAKAGGAQVSANSARIASNPNASKGTPIKRSPHTNNTNTTALRKKISVRAGAGHIAAGVSVLGLIGSIGGNKVVGQVAKVVVATPTPTAGHIHHGLFFRRWQVKNGTKPWHQDIFGGLKDAEAPARALWYGDGSKWTLLYAWVFALMLVDYLILEPLSRRREPLPADVATALEETYKSSTTTSNACSRKAIMQMCRCSPATAELFGVALLDQPWEESGRFHEIQDTPDQPCKEGGELDTDKMSSEGPCKRSDEFDDDFYSLHSEEPINEFEDRFASRFELLGETMNSVISLEELKHFFQEEIQPMSKSTFVMHVLALIFWLAMAGAFNMVVSQRMGSDAAWQFSSGYALEWLLSMDNLFVFHLIFKVYRTPRELVHKALFAGIFGAILFRMVAFVALTEVVSMLSWARLVVGLFLMYSGVMTVVGNDDDEADVGNNFLVILLGASLGDRMLKTYDKNGIFLSVDGKLCASLLLPVIVCIEVSDILFAWDSVSAKVAQIPDYYISYSSSIFALFGLRAMFFLIQEMVDLFHMLKYGLAFIIVFIGAGMVFSDYIELPAQTVCILICGVFITCIGASLLTSRDTAMRRSSEHEEVNTPRCSSDSSF